LEYTRRTGNSNYSHSSITPFVYTVASALGTAEFLHLETSVILLRIVQEGLELCKMHASDDSSTPRRASLPPTPRIAARRTLSGDSISSVASFGSVRAPTPIAAASGDYRGYRSTTGKKLHGHASCRYLKGKSVSEGPFSQAAFDLHGCSACGDMRVPF
jgi:hypothetical protein